MRLRAGASCAQPWWWPDCRTAGWQGSLLGQDLLWAAGTPAVDSLPGSSGFLLRRDTSASPTPPGFLSSGGRKEEADETMVETEIADGCPVLAKAA